MPDADIPPIVLTNDEIKSLQDEVPMLPPEYRKRWATLGVDASVVNALLDNINYAILVNEVQNQAGDDAARVIAHLFASSIAKLLKGETLPTTGLFDKRLNIAPEDLIELAEINLAKEISSNNTELLFFEIVKNAHDDQRFSPRQQAMERDMLQVSDEEAIAVFVDEVLSDPASSSSIEDIRAGKDKAIGYLVGQVMKKSRGKANPALAQRLIKEKIAV
jgi:aspartyl-tRNA(Asn)/glutamyl-tRNA(Gln) amidotransferase subunit B